MTKDKVTIDDLLKAGIFEHYDYLGIQKNKDSPDLNIAIYNCNDCNSTISLYNLKSHYETFHTGEKKE